MSKKRHLNSSAHWGSEATALQAMVTIGPILVVVGAIGYGFALVAAYAGWLIIIGGLLGAFGLLLSSLRASTASSRVKRLERMSFLGFLLFVVAGGFMVQGSGSWLPLLSVGTVFYLYSVFVKDRVLKKECK